MAAVRLKSSFRMVQLKSRRAALSALLFCNRRVEVGILLRHPVDKFAHHRIGEQRVDVHGVALQFAIGEMGDDGLLADRMHRHHIPPAPAFRHRMMPDNGLAGRPPAKPASWSRGRSLLLLGHILIATMFGMFAGHVLVPVLVELVLPA